MSAMTSEITGVSIIYSIVCSGADQRKHQSSSSPAFVRVIHRWPMNSLHRGRLTRKVFPFNDVIMKFDKPAVKYLNTAFTLPLLRHTRVSISDWTQTACNLISSVVAITITVAYLSPSSLGINSGSTVGHWVEWCHLGVYHTQVFVKYGKIRSQSCCTLIFVSFVVPQWKCVTYLSISFRVASFDPGQLYVYSRGTEL